MTWKTFKRTSGSSIPSGEAPRTGPATTPNGATQPTREEEGTGSCAVRPACHAACRWCAPLPTGGRRAAGQAASSFLRCRITRPTPCAPRQADAAPPRPARAAHAKPASRKPHNITGSYATARRAHRQDQRTAGGSHKPRYVQARVPRGVECTPRRPLKVATATGPFFFLPTRAPLGVVAGPTLAH